MHNIAQGPANGFDQTSWIDRFPHMPANAVAGRFNQEIRRLFVRYHDHRQIDFVQLYLLGKPNPP